MLLLLCPCSQLPPVGHQALVSPGHQLLPQRLVDRPTAWGLLRLLQGDLLQRQPPHPTGQQGQVKEERDGQGGEDCDAGVLQPDRPHRRQRRVDLAPLHRHAGRGDPAGKREPAEHLGTKLHVGPLRRGRHHIWDVQTVGARWTRAQREDGTYSGTVLHRPAP